MPPPAPFNIIYNTLYCIIEIYGGFSVTFLYSEKTEKKRNFQGFSGCFLFCALFFIRHKIIQHQHKIIQHRKSGFFALRNVFILPFVCRVTFLYSKKPWTAFYFLHGLLYAFVSCMSLMFSRLRLYAPVMPCNGLLSVGGVFVPLEPFCASCAPCGASHVLV